MTSAMIQAARVTALRAPAAVASSAITPSAASSASAGVNSAWYLAQPPKKSAITMRELAATQAAAPDSNAKARPGRQRRM